MQRDDFVSLEPSSSIRLNFLEGPKAGELIELPRPQSGEGPITFGRSPDNSITIVSPHLSRRHAEIYTDKYGRLLIQDTGSVNGTQVNGRNVPTGNAVLLNPGDQVRIGDTLFSLVGQQLKGNEEITDQTPTPTYRTPSTIPPPESNREEANVVPEGAHVYIVLDNGQHFLFEGEEAVVGRGQGNDIVIDSNSISRQHARLQKTPTGIYLSDLGSTNKTFVNGGRADGPVLLHNGDLLRFGEVEASFLIEDNRLSGRVDMSEHTVIDKFFDTTRNDIPPLTSVLSQSGSGSNYWEGPGLEQLETAIDLDVRIVGRKGRRASEALPEEDTIQDRQVSADGPSVLAAPQELASKGEVARLEGVYMTEGQGRASQLMLQNVRLGLRQGELVVVIGPSGSGKSELVQIMAGLLPADKGRVVVLGREIPTLESAGRRLNLEADRDFGRWRARNIGYLNSNEQLDPRRATFENLTQVMEVAGIGKDNRERQERAFERLKLVGLHDREVMRLKPTDLTRTEKQLVLLARALANDPPLLLCDEPLANLNSSAASYVFSLLQNLVKGGKTVLMATQDQLWARNASRIIEILDGAIVGSLS